MTHKTKNLQTLVLKKFFFFVANASCTIETNRTLNPVYKCFTINQNYRKLSLFLKVLRFICNLFIYLTYKT